MSNIWFKFWSRLRPRDRHWLFNIALGVCIEVALLIGHVNHIEPIVAIDNWAMDSITRLTHAICSTSSPSTSTPVDRFLNCQASAPAQRPVLAAINDSTWRSAAWGGGEPQLAPRDALAKLIERLFELGAGQVVLDIAVEDRRLAGASTKTADASDKELAKRLDQLLAQPHFGADRRLILVRTERRAVGNDAETYLPELKSSSEIDAVVARSKGRILVAAPYFVIAKDRVVRQWDLFRVVCERSSADPREGWLRIVPSVQLAVEMHRRGVDAQLIAPPHSHVKCQPFPIWEDADSSSADVKVRLCELTQVLGRPLVQGQGESGCLRSATRSGTTLVEQYWAGIAKALSPVDPPRLPKHGEIGNRVVFSATSRDIETIAVDALLADDPGLQSTYGRALGGRTVIIGQTNEEAADFLYSPLGRMPGAVVLFNAIESMRRTGLLVEVAWWVEILLIALIVTVVGYIFARFDSVIGTIVSTAVVLPAVGIASAIYFAHGGWLNFLLPALGIQIHRWIDVWKEWGEHRPKAASHGTNH